MLTQANVTTDFKMTMDNDSWAGKQYSHVTSHALV